MYNVEGGDQIEAIRRHRILIEGCSIANEKLDICKAVPLGLFGSCFNRSGTCIHTDNARIREGLRHEACCCTLATADVQNAHIVVCAQCRHDVLLRQKLAPKRSPKLGAGPREGDLKLHPVHRHLGLVRTAIRCCAAEDHDAAGPLHMEEQKVRSAGIGTVAGFACAEQYLSALQNQNGLALARLDQQCRRILLGRPVRREHLQAAHDAQRPSQLVSNSLRCQRFPCTPWASEKNGRPTLELSSIKKAPLTLKYTSCPFVVDDSVKGHHAAAG
mmetsp:Transcript_41851/g.118385  ORF Transcript_41851/g.118385 Transcript_41851/m.118385 type:complete len:273 (-) Transcript_41851:339-1157(-)